MKFLLTVVAIALVDFDRTVAANAWIQAAGALHGVEETVSGRRDGFFWSKGYILVEGMGSKGRGVRIIKKDSKSSTGTQLYSGRTAICQ